MGRKINQPVPESARELARRVKQLLWWHRMKGVSHLSFRCHFDGEADRLTLLCDNVLKMVTPSLFQGVPDDDDANRGQPAVRLHSPQAAEGDV